MIASSSIEKNRLTAGRNWKQIPTAENGRQGSRKKLKGLVADGIWGKNTEAAIRKTLKER